MMRSPPAAVFLAFFRFEQFLLARRDLAQETILCCFRRAREIGSRGGADFPADPFCGKTYPEAR